MGSILAVESRIPSGSGGRFAMRTIPLTRARRAGLLMFGLAAGLMIGGCGGDDGGGTATTGASTIVAPTTLPPTTVAPTTVAPTTLPPTTAPPTTEPMGSNVESLSYLIQGLLTTEQIGGGWVDQGRRIVPPGSEQLSGFLCAEGETAVAALGGRFDPQVSTTYLRPDDVGLSVSDSLMWGDRDQVTADFESFVAALDACRGTTYTTADLGELTLTVDEAPDLGVAATAFRFGPVAPPTENPWLESQMTAVLLSDPSQPVALVVWVSALSIHDPFDLDVTKLDPAEYARITEAAVNRIVEEGL
jgi:hypothetical protein